MRVIQLAPGIWNVYMAKDTLFIVADDANNIPDIRMMVAAPIGADVGATANARRRTIRCVSLRSGREVALDARGV